MRQDSIFYFHECPPFISMDSFIEHSSIISISSSNTPEALSLKFFIVTFNLIKSNVIRSIVTKCSQNENKLHKNDI